MQITYTQKTITSPKSTTTVTLAVAMYKDQLVYATGKDQKEAKNNILKLFDRL